MVSPSHTPHEVPSLGHQSEIGSDGPTGGPTHHLSSSPSGLFLSEAHLVSFRPRDFAEFDTTVPGIDLRSSPTLKLESRGTTSHVPTSKQAEFWASQTAQRVSIAAKLREVGREDLAGDLEDCSSRTSIALCTGCKTAKVFRNRCDRFYCPSCTPKLAADRRDSVEWWAKSIQQPKHVVLTLRNFPKLTKDHVGFLKLAFGRLRRRAFARNWVGGFYSLEVTNEGRGWHLHLHALVDARWIDGGELARQWDSVTGGAGHIVKVKDCRRADYLAEVTKYAVKGSELASWSGSEILDFITAFSGARTFGVFGSLYGKRTEWAAWIESVKEDRSKCSCGCSDWHLMSPDEYELWLCTHGPTAANPPPAPKPVQVSLAFAASNDALVGGL